MDVCVCVCKYVEILKSFQLEKGKLLAGIKMSAIEKSCTGSEGLGHKARFSSGATVDLDALPGRATHC